MKELVKNNAHLQYHSKSHKDLTSLNKQELEIEIKCPKEIKDLDINGFKFFAYPFWRYNNTVIEIVKKYYMGARSGNGYSDNSLWALDAIKMKNNIHI